MASPSGCDSRCHDRDTRTSAPIISNDRGRAYLMSFPPFENNMNSTRLDVLVAADNHDAADSLADPVHLLAYEAVASYAGAPQSTPARRCIQGSRFSMPKCRSWRGVRPQRPFEPSIFRRVHASLTGLDPDEAPPSSDACQFDIRLDKPLRFEQLRIALNAALGPPG